MPLRNIVPMRNVEALKNIVPLKNIILLKNPGNNKTLSSEQEELFKKSFEEEYDLCIDSEYNAWLKMYHPVSLVDETLSSRSAVAEYLHVAPLSPILTSSKVTHTYVFIAFRRGCECFNNNYTFRAIRCFYNNYTFRVIRR